LPLDRPAKSGRGLGWKREPASRTLVGAIGEQEENTINVSIRTAGRAANPIIDNLRHISSWKSEGKRLSLPSKVKKKFLSR